MAYFWFRSGLGVAVAAVKSNSRTVSGDTWAAMPVALIYRTGRRRI